MQQLRWLLYDHALLWFLLCLSCYAMYSLICSGQSHHSYNILVGSCCFISVLSVGFEEVEYEVSESDVFVEVCVAILSPPILQLSNTSSVVFLLSTLSQSATGKHAYLNEYSLKQHDNMNTIFIDYFVL